MLKAQAGDVNSVVPRLVSFHQSENRKPSPTPVKRLEWCMDHQYFGDDIIARGSLVGRSWASGITFRHWWDVVVTYTVAFFGDALAEALSLDVFSEDK